MMPRKKRSLSSFSFHNVNPFISQVITEFKAKNKMKRVGVTTQDILNADTGEIESQKLIVLGKKEYVDSEEFAKIFIKNVGFFYELSKSDLKVFQYLLNKTEYNSDVIYIHAQKVAHDTDLSVQTIYNSLSILIEREIIARANSLDSFFVNPKVFFKGDRLVLINEYKKINTSQLKK